MKTYYLLLIFLLLHGSIVNAQNNFQQLNDKAKRIEATDSIGNKEYAIVVCHPKVIGKSQFLIYYEDGTFEDFMVISNLHAIDLDFVSRKNGFLDIEFKLIKYLRNKGFDLFIRESLYGGGDNKFGVSISSREWVFKREKTSIPIH